MTETEKGIPMKISEAKRPTRVEYTNDSEVAPGEFLKDADGDLYILTADGFVLPIRDNYGNRVNIASPREMLRFACAEPLSPVGDKLKLS